MNLFKSLSISFLIFFTGCAGLQPLPEGEKTVMSVVEVPGKSKDQIYIATKTWVAENFKSAKAVLEVDSRQDGLIIGNGNIPYPCAGLSDCMSQASSTVAFTVKCEIKDYKYRVNFTNIRIMSPGKIGHYPATDSPIHWQNDMDKIRPKLIELAASLEAGIKMGAKSDF